MILKEQTIWKYNQSMHWHNLKLGEKNNLNKEYKE